MSACSLVATRMFNRTLAPVCQQILQHQFCPQKLLVKTVQVLFGHPRQFSCTAASRYGAEDQDYLDSEEYVARYGDQMVWTGYRRNHKGGIPPQNTRKTCIRGDRITGNPCPICRDPNLRVHHQNVKLLQQFISPHTGIVYDPTQTGVCMKQQKKLNEAINTARDHGLLAFQVPHVDFSGETYSNTHDAVGSTPPLPGRSSGETWYTWYRTVEPNPSRVARVQKTYKAYLK